MWAGRCVTTNALPTTTLTQNAQHLCFGPAKEADDKAFQEIMPAAARSALGAATARSIHKLCPRPPIQVESNPSAVRDSAATVGIPARLQSDLCAAAPVAFADVFPRLATNVNVLDLPTMARPTVHKRRRS